MIEDDPLLMLDPEEMKGTEAKDFDDDDDEMPALQEEKTLEVKMEAMEVTKGKVTMDAAKYQQVSSYH